jgi:hypothetical protein
MLEKFIFIFFSLPHCHNRTYWSEIKAVTVWQWCGSGGSETRNTEKKP